MFKKFRYKDITWVDLQSPNAEEVEKLGREFTIHPVALGELLSPSERAKVDIYNDFIYLVLHFPTGEVDFILGKNFIITTHYEFSNPLNDFAKIFESDFVLKKNHEKLHAGFIFFYILKEIYGEIERELNSLNQRLKTVEEKIFVGEELAVVKTLSTINRQLLDFRWTLKGQREILQSLELAGTEFFGEKFVYYLKALSGEHQKIWGLVENQRETFTDLRETNESLLNIKTNETIKTLTVIAFIFLPLNLLANIFSTSLQLPVILSPTGDFYLMLVAMLALVWGMIKFARSRQWL